MIDIGLIWACNDSVSGCVGECDFVIVEVMVLSLIVLENVCGGAGGSDDQELRWSCLACGDCGGT